MFALSRTMYLFEVNLNLLANTSTHDVAQYHLEQNFTASCLRSWSTGLIEREIPMQYHISTEMYVDKCTENQVCNDCTYRRNSVSEVLSEDARLSIYFSFKVLNALQNNMSRVFRIVLSCLSTLENLLNIFIVRYHKDSNPNKIFRQRTNLIRQKSFSCLKKCFKSKQNFPISSDVIYTASKNELKMIWLSRNTKVLDSFPPQKWEVHACSM